MTPAPRQRLGVAIIACNEERDLPRCLDSVAFADDRVVVVDARSRDATEAIARARGARIFLREYEGNVQQKNFALEQAQGDWLLGLDADEAVSPQLAAEIQALLAAPPDGVEGFEIDRVTWHLGRWIRHGDFHPDWQLRLFRRGTGRFAGQNPHGRVQVRGRTGRLQGPLEHYAYRDLSDQLDRIQDFSSVQAQGQAERGRSAVVWNMITRPFARFLRAYVVKQGFRDGVPGFVIAATTSFYVFAKYAKQWELQRLGATASPPQAARGKAARRTS